jgi:hypothetical protein
MILSASCDRDCPECPQDPIPVSYYVYFADNNGVDNNYIWIANSATDSLIDSILTPPGIRGMNISDDGAYLAILLPYDSIFIYDLGLNTLIHKWAPPEPLGFGTPYFSNNGVEIIVAYPDGNALQKYTLDGNLLAQDTTYFDFYGHLNYSSCIYGTKYGADTNWHYIYDYANMFVMKKFILFRDDSTMPYTVNMTVSPDDNIGYFIIRPDKVFKYDITSDSILDSIFIINGAYWGDLNITPEGNYLLVSEVPDPWNMSGPIGTFLIVDATSMTTYKRVSTWGIISDSPVYPAAVGDIIIAPDGSKAYVAGRDGFGYTRPISIDLYEFSASAIEGMRANASIISLAIGAKIP